MTYEALAKFAQTSGSVYFAILFAAVCAYAFWPKNKAKFDSMAQMPLDKANDEAPIHVEN